MKRFTLFSVLWMLLLSRAFGAENGHSQDVFKATLLIPQVYMIEGSLGNITASIGPDGVLLVDCDFAEMSEKLLGKLKELQGGAPRFIINTHFHTGGNQVFGSSATIIAATSVRDRLKTEQLLWKKTHPAFPSVALPILTFDQLLSLHFNGEEVQMVHFPGGHTDGDTAVFFEKGKVASLGDLYFAGMYPIFHPEHQGRLKSYVDNIGAIIQRLPNNAQIVPGHGPLSNKKELERYHQMMMSSIATVQSGIRKKMTLEQIQKQGLPSEWASFSHGYRTTHQWIESIYQSIK
jgi:glyoxylase-like metal-dependent hydrolase (beta-lactamase superfamily II)